MTSIDKIKIIQNDILTIQKELDHTLNIVQNLKFNLDTKKKLLLDTCPHTNKIRKRENGPYGERYWYCDDCKLELKV